MNPTPQEAAKMDPLELATVLFRRNFRQRNVVDSYWRRIHRRYAKQHIADLRQLTNRPPKRHKRVAVRLRDLQEGDLFCFPGRIAPQRYRGNGWYGGNGDGGPYHRNDNPTVERIR